MVMTHFKQCRREEGKNKNHHSICPSHSPVETTGNSFLYMPGPALQTDIPDKLVF